MLSRLFDYLACYFAKRGSYALLIEQYLENSIAPSVVLDDLSGITGNKEFYELDFPFSYVVLAERIRDVFLEDSSISLINIRGADGVNYFVEYFVEKKEFGLAVSIASIKKASDTIKVVSELKEKVEYDPLTGVLTKNQFIELYDEHEDSECSYLFVVDMDFFKSVNDIYGHSIGDEVLKSVAKGLDFLIGESGLIGRFGGEEFCIIKYFDSDNEARFFAKRVNSYFREEKLCSSPVISRTVSIGCCKTSGRSFDIAFFKADQAALIAKEHGRDTSIIYDKKLDIALRRKGKMLSLDDIRNAIERGDVFYDKQAIIGYDGECSLVKGYELFLRMRGKDGTVYVADAFMGKFLEVCRDDYYAEIMKNNRSSYIRSLKLPSWQVIAFNIKISSILASQNAFHFVNNFLDKDISQSCNIVFEISALDLTDRTNFSEVRKRLSYLKSVGIILALDHFGLKGFDLKPLNELPFKMVKVVSNSQLDAIFLNFLENSGYQVVVTNVETKAEATRMIEKCGVRWLQGHCIKLEKGKVELLHFNAA